MDKRQSSGPMRRAVLAAFLLFLALPHRASPCPQAKAKVPPSKGTRALALIARDYGLNFHLIRDEFDRFGWKIASAGVTPEVQPCAKDAGMTILRPDLLTSEIEDLSPYDCLVIAPAAGNFREVENSYGDVLESRKTLDLIAAAARRGMPVFAMCSAARVLAAAGIVEGKKIVGSPRFEEEYRKAGAVYLGNPRNDTPPMIDGTLVTATRGQVYNKANCEALATVLESRKTRGDKKTIKPSRLVSTPVEMRANGVERAAVLRQDSGAAAARSVCPTPDGGFVFAGHIVWDETGDADMLLVAADRTGRVKWAGSYGGSGAEYANHILALPDGFLLTGYTSSFGAGSRDVYLVKVDVRGNEIWSRAFGGPSWDVGVGACRAGDGYVVCGHTHSSGKGEEDVYLIKVDGSGHEIWSRTFGGSRIEMAAGVVPAGDGGFFIGASTLSYGSGTDFLLIRADAEGKEVWSKAYDFRGGRGHGFEWLTGIAALRDGGVALVGYEDGTDLMDVCVLKADAKGKEVWTKTFGRPGFYDFGTAIRETQDGGLVVAGVTKTMIQARELADNDVFAAGLDASGRVLWQTVLARPGREWAEAALILDGGNIAVCGQASAGTDSFGIFLAEIRPGGTAGRTDVKID